MYTHLLSSVQGDMVEDLAGEALICYAVACRTATLDSGLHSGQSVYAALATEVAYDRALIKLCRANGVEAIESRFSHPRDERDRLEDELAAAGIDLAALARMGKDP
jgi:hypothetical protein